MTPEEIAALKAENDSIKAKLKEYDDEKVRKAKEEAENKGNQEKDFSQKVEDSKRERERQAGDTRKLERALKFTLQSDIFKKEHQEILSKDVTDLFDEANKQKFDSEIDKANSIKSAMIQSFFKLQANLDYLTPDQKQTIEDYYKLSARGKEEKADDLFMNVFEPCLGLIHKVKKAEQLGKSKAGLSDSDSTEDNYKKRLIAQASKHHLGVKQDGA
jgi:hypothetical protein